MDESKTSSAEPQESEATDGATAAACPVDHTAAASAEEPTTEAAPKPAPKPAPKLAPKAAKAEKAAEPEKPTIHASELPGPKTHSMVQVLQYWRHPADFMLKSREKYGSRFALSRGIPPRPLYVITDPEDVKKMFLAPADVLHTGLSSAMIEKFTGTTGLAWLDEDEHKVRRKQLMPTMHGKALQRIEASIDEMTKEDVAAWPRGEITALHPYIHRLTLNVIREVIFGKVIPSCWDELLDVLTQMMRFNDKIMSTMMIHRMSVRTIRTLRAIRPLGLDEFLKLRDRADGLIAQAVKERWDSGDLGNDFLSALLGITHEDGSQLSAVELRDEMMTIFLAGTETTAVALAWSFLYLSRSPEVCERLVAEIDAGESDAYLTATAQETLRLRPSIPNMIARQVMKPIEIGGVRYEPGMLIWASAFLLHRNPTLYPDPEEFRPERFLGVKPGIHTWIPFGGGRIRCLGADIAISEMKAVLREVLSTCEIVKADPAPEALKSRIVVIRPDKGARLELRNRTREPSLVGD